MSTTESIKHLLLRLADPVFDLDLPFGVYLVTDNGSFVKCNQEIRRLLDLPSSGTVVDNITRFYPDPKERDRLRRLADALPEGESLKEYCVSFRVGVRDVWVTRQCRAIRDPRTKNTIGYMGYVMDITAEASFSRIRDELLGSAYRLDNQDRLQKVDPAIPRLLGYDDLSEFLGHPVREFYLVPEEADEILSKVIRGQLVFRERCELRHKTGEPVTVFITARAIKAPDGTYIGREGTITHALSDVGSRLISEAIPLGMYMVLEEGGVPMLHEWNQVFSDMFELDQESKLCGVNIKSLYADPDRDYPAFQAAIEEAWADGHKPLPNLPLSVRTFRSRRRFEIEVSSAPLVDGRGHFFGRVGVARDVSEELALLKLRDDLAPVLHSYIGMLTAFSDSLQVLSGPFEDSTLPRQKTPEIARVWQAIEQPVSRLGESLSELIAELQGTGSGVSSELAEFLSALEAERLAIQETIPRIEFGEHRFSFVFDISRKLNALFSQLTLGYETRVFNETRVQTEALLRRCYAIEFRRLRDMLFDIDHPARAVCDSVSLYGLTDDVSTRCRISKLLASAIAHMGPSAKKKGVRIVTRTFGLDPYVQVNDREVQRAIMNLLHNAVKYTKSRDSSESRWIMVFLRPAPGAVRIEIENFGVPIMKEELEQELIFRPGIRGALAGSGHRPGTGFGLHDARLIARKHGGELVLQSRPARENGGADDYSIPYLTTAILMLPVVD